jgi:hypothetical protein
MNIKTIIYCPIGYFGSEKLWNDASYAFQHKDDGWRNYHYGTYSRYQSKGLDDNWTFLGNDRRKLAEQLKIDIDVLPGYDYEHCELEANYEYEI